MTSCLRFGTGGVPISTTQTKDNTGKTLNLRSSAIHRLNELGLDHMEVEFVHGVKMKEDDALSLGSRAKEHNISLTVHGPYYINLASQNSGVLQASIKRVQDTIRSALWLGANSVTFHPGFYQKRSSHIVTDIITKSLRSAISDFLHFKPNHTDTKERTELAHNLPLISLETTGKPSQWGSFEETLSTARKLNDEYDRFIFSVCVDFAHLYARSNGAFNTRNEFDSILCDISDTLGTQALTSLRVHISGINYSEKGERNHLVLEDSDLQWKDILKTLHQHNVSGWVVCESPNLEKDATEMKKYYQNL